MSEQSFISALKGISDTLEQLALQATEPDDPLAYPEPRDDDEINAFQQNIEALRGYVSDVSDQADPKYNSLLNTTLRDYKAGYPDRCGAYMVEFLDRLKKEDSYARNFSAHSQGEVDTQLAGLREL